MNWSSIEITTAAIYIYYFFLATELSKIHRVRQILLTSSQTHNNVGSSIMFPEHSIQWPGYWGLK